MNRTWEEIKSIFEPDGSLLDIYVHKISLSDWEKVINLINQKYTVNYNNLIDKDDVFNFLTDKTGELEYKTAFIDLGNIQINCHFFLEDEIEFDIDPKEVNSLKDFEKTEKFITNISYTLDKKVILTPENYPEYLLLEIDTNRKTNKLFNDKK